jgi:hypothetical protein
MITTQPELRPWPTISKGFALQRANESISSVKPLASFEEELRYVIVGAHELATELWLEDVDSAQIKHTCLG